MNGNVSGLPIAVPSAAATRLPRRKKVIVQAMMMWKPRNGVNEANTPAATPIATA